MGSCQFICDREESVELNMMYIQIILLIICVNISIGVSKFEKNLWKTWKNNTFHSFRGIKYAESPTGSLRFKVSEKNIEIF